jgi:hypothetical protein
VQQLTGNFSCHKQKERKKERKRERKKEREQKREREREKERKKEKMLTQMGIIKKVPMTLCQNMPHVH